MSLVQAPPLAELSGLTADFKVNDEPLAGIVQGDIKVFSTTIRPRRQGVTEIPAIPFSFFDPSTQKFVTVRSEPIAVTVSKADMLALTSIVGDAGEDTSANQAIRGDRSGPMLDNYEGASVLRRTNRCLFPTRDPLDDGTLWRPCGADLCRQGDPELGADSQSISGRTERDRRGGQCEYRRPSDAALR